MNRIEKQRQAQAKKGFATVKKDKPIEPPGSIPPKKAPEPPKKRKFDGAPLPIGSHDEAHYVGDARWVGKLHIALGNGEFKTFECERSTRFTLHSALYRLYLAWKESREENR